MTCDVSRTDQAVVKKQLLFKSSNSTEPSRWAMNLSITPHCRLDTQFIYHRHALYQITTLLYLATKGRAPNRVVTVAHDSSKHYCLRQTSAWLSVWNTSNFRSTIYTVFVSTGNDPFAGSPTKTLLRLLLLLNEQVWASSRAMCSCRNSQHRPVRRPH
jgi:hypothetical protein